MSSSLTLPNTFWKDQHGYQYPVTTSINTTAIADVTSVITVDTEEVARKFNEVFARLAELEKRIEYIAKYYPQALKEADANVRGKERLEVE